MVSIEKGLIVKEVIVIAKAMIGGHRPGNGISPVEHDNKA
jgi:hypothetical protein